MKTVSNASSLSLDIRNDNTQVPANREKKHTKKQAWLFVWNSPLSQEASVMRLTHHGLPQDGGWCPESLRWSGWVGGTQCSP